jgi:hypothetical protein
VQDGPTSGEQAKDNQAASAFNKGRLSDGTWLNINDQTGDEQGIRVSEDGTSSNPLKKNCWECSNGETGHGGEYNVSALQGDDSPGHTHPGLIGPLPGRGDAGLAAPGRGVYEISKRGAFAIEKTDVGYRIREVAGKKPTVSERKQMRKQINEWNSNAGASNSGDITCSSNGC